MSGYVSLTHFSVSPQYGGRLFSTPKGERGDCEKIDQRNDIPGLYCEYIF